MTSDLCKAMGNVYVDWHHVSGNGSLRFVNCVSEDFNYVFFA